MKFFETFWIYRRHGLRYAFRRAWEIEVKGYPF